MGEKSIVEITKTQGEQACIDGFVSGHSFRRAVITRLHQAGVPSTIIKEFSLSPVFMSGHRSNAVDDYKVTSTKQKTFASTVLQGKKGKFKPVTRFIFIYFIWGAGAFL